MSLILLIITVRAYYERTHLGAPTSMRVLGRHAKKVRPDDREGVILVEKRIIVIFRAVGWLVCGKLIGVMDRRAGSTVGGGQRGLKWVDCHGPW